MKTILSKRYAIKVGNAYLSQEITRLVKQGVPNESNSELERTVLPRTWTNKREAQAVADHVRGEFKPEAGDVVVAEFQTLLLR